jgi:hypothetical protein
MPTWRERLDHLSAAIDRARANAKPLLNQSEAEAVYRLLDEYRLAGAPGLDSEVPAARIRSRAALLKTRTCGKG